MGVSCVRSTVCCVLCVRCEMLRVGFVPREKREGLAWGLVFRGQKGKCMDALHKLTMVISLRNITPTSTDASIFYERLICAFL